AARPCCEGDAEPEGEDQRGGPGQEVQTSLGERTASIVRARSGRGGRGFGRRFAFAARVHLVGGTTIAGLLAVAGSAALAGLLLVAGLLADTGRVPVAGLVAPPGPSPTPGSSPSPGPSPPSACGATNTATVCAGIVTVPLSASQRAPLTTSSAPSACTSCSRWSIPAMPSIASVIGSSEALNTV